MKRCPECRRDYYDDSLLYCLEDGAELLYGPPSRDEPQTAIMHESVSPSEAATRAQIHTTEQTAALPSDVLRDAKSKRFDRRLLLAPLALAVIVSSGVGAYLYFSPIGSKQIESIAVMPFVNESGNADVEYLSDGMTETLISSLSQLPNLSVKGRSSVFRYKGKDLDTKTLGKELGVQAVLYGRVIQRDDELTLSLELLDTITENVIWSGKYHRRGADVVSLQSEIARDVSNKLKTRLSGSDAAKVQKGYTTSPDAYRLYLQGRYQLNRKTEDGFRKAIGFFQQAIEQDPDYALAYAGVADVYNQMGAWTLLPPRESFPMAKAAAEKALALNDDLAEAHSCLAFVKFYYEWQFAEAERGYQRAISLNPNSATAREQYGYQIYLTNPRRFDEAIRELNTARDLDPLSLSSNFGIATLFYFERNYDEAARRLREMQSIDPHFTLGYGLLGAVYIRKKMGDEAVAAILKGSTLEGGGLTEQQASVLRRVHHNVGLKGFLREHAKILQEVSRDRYVSPIFIAMDYAHLGANESAIVWLEKAYEERSSWLTEIAVDPVWDELRPDPRFQDLMRRMGLPPRISNSKP